MSDLSSAIGFLDTEHLKSDLKGRSIRGGAITVFSQGCKFVLQTGSTVVLARLLTPDDFGLIAMVMAVTGFAMMFSSLGLSTATVQKAEINHGQISTLFWINVGLGIVVAGVVIGLAPAVAWFYKEPRLIPVTMALGAPFVFGGLAVQHRAMLQRNMRFFAMGMVEIVSMAAGVAAAIVASVFGAGYWSLVIMYIAMAVAAAVGNWIAFPWLPGLPKRGVGIKQMLGFGGNITGFNIVNYFARNADNILIGKIVGAAALGFYSKAYGLLMLPIRQIREPINMVAIPVMSRLQQMPERFCAYYEKLVFAIAFVGMPLICLMAVCANELIFLVLGPQWLPAAPTFQVLAVAAFIQLVSHSWGVVLIALGKSRRYLNLGVLNALVMCVAFLIGIYWGIVFVAAAYAVANAVVLFPILYIAFKGTSVSMRNFLHAVAMPFIGSIVLLVSTLAARRIAAGQSEIVVVGLTVLAGIASYTCAFLIMPGGLKKLVWIWGLTATCFKRKPKHDSLLSLNK